MRELKFRAWGININEYMGISNDPSNVINILGELINSRTWIIEQYTGLKDKNGKEIYEGDIVDYNDGGECMGVVEYDAPIFILNDERFENLGSLFLKGAPHQKVIGNIHENPELLEKE